MKGVKLFVLQDNAMFIERAINNVQEHALIGGVLVVLIIFAFLRDWRSTLIVSTSIPVSVIGTFALLYFGGYTLNTMTFGGLALGIGMIVDAAIVVLENTHRHLHMGKDRMTAAIDGSEEVWSAILASTLTHIAVFIPLLFLSGTASILFGQLSIVVIFSLAMSLFVAVTIVPVLCSRWLKTAEEEAAATGVMARLFRVSERFLEAMDEQYRRAIHVALNHRPTVLLSAAALTVLAAVLYPRIGVELLPQADEGEVTVNAELGVGTRIELTEKALLTLEGMVKAARARGGHDHHAAAAAAVAATAAAAATRAAAIAARSVVVLKPRDQRTRTNEEIAIALRRELAGLPGVQVRANPSGGNFQLQRLLGGGGGNDSRLALEIRGHDLDDARRIARDARVADGGHPGSGGRQHRPRGRPSGDRDSRRSAQGRHARAVRRRRSRPPFRRTSPARPPRSSANAATSTRSSSGCAQSDREQIADVGDVLLSTPNGQVIPAKNVMDVEPRSRSGADRSEEHGAHHARQRGDRGQPQQGRRGGAGAAHRH